MSSPEMSKRERQKQRREAKLAQERQAEAKARRMRLLALGLAVLVFLGLIGAAVANNRAEKRRLAEQREAVQARLDELGCTPDEEQADAGAGHIEAAALATSPPDVLYPERPATSGQHFGNWLKTGVYDQQLDERALVHNLEHGYVVVYYDDGADDAQVEELKTFAQEQIDGKYPKLIVAPWDESGELADDKNFAFTAWRFRQMCEDFDTATLDVFLQEHHSGAGIAPEKTIPAHTEEGNGTIDPGTEPFLLPPLGQATAPEGGTDDAGSEAPGATDDPEEDTSATEATS